MSSEKMAAFSLEPEGPVKVEVEALPVSEERKEKSTEFEVPAKPQKKRPKRKRKKTIEPDTTAEVPDLPKVKAIGSRMDVYYGMALQTAGGLTKDDLCLNKRGRVVSKRASERARARFPEIQGRLRSALLKAN